MKLRRIVLPVVMLVLLMVLASPAFAEFDMSAKKWSGSFKLTGLQNYITSKAMPVTAQFSADKTFKMTIAKASFISGTYSLNDMNLSITATAGSGELISLANFNNISTESLLRIFSGTVPITNDKGSFKMIVEQSRSYEGVTGTGKLTLTRPEIKATSVSLILPEGGSKTLTVGQSEPYQLGYTIKPASSDSVVRFKTSSKSVATVSSTGVVTPVSAGKTGKKSVTITAYTNNGKKKTVKLTVEDPTVARSIALDVPSTYKMMVGETHQLMPTLTPATATSPVTYKSSVPGIATVDKNTGIITAVATSAKKSGKKYTSTVITATCNGHTKKITVKVMDETSKQAMIIYDGTGGASKPIPSISMAVGDRRNLVAYLLPDKEMSAATWTSSNKRVATVDKATGEVTGVKSGSATITGKVGKVTSTIKVTVHK